MINWNQFTVDNGAITDLRELLFLTVYDDPDIDLTVTTKTGVTNGQKLGYINDLGDVGEKGGGCDPAYTSVNITGIQKEWELGGWEGNLLRRPREHHRGVVPQYRHRHRVSPGYSLLGRRTHASSRKGYPRNVLAYRVVRRQGR